MNNILSEQDAKAVLEILVKQLDVPEAQLTPDARIQEDFSSDSLTFAQINLDVEDRFNVSIPEDEWEAISTVGDLFKAIEKQLEKEEK